MNRVILILIGGDGSDASGAERAGRGAPMLGDLGQLQGQAFGEDLVEAG